MRSKFLILFLLFATILIVAQEGETVARLEGKLLINPKVSPDGNSVAFTQEGYNGIFIFNEKSGVVQLTEEPASGFGFSWLSDNSGIISRAARFSGPYRENQVVIYTLADKGRTPASPLSSKITVLPGVSTAGEPFSVFENTVHSFNMSTRSLEATLPLGIAAFVENDKISVTSTSGKRVIEPVKGQRCINASISPDGSKVVFEIIGGNLYVINTDGTGLVDLGKGYRGAWAPDSRRIAYMVTEDDGHVITASDIWQVNADGSGKTRLTSTSTVLEMDPAFSPVGKFIYYASINDGSIMRMSAEVGK